MELNFNDILAGKEQKAPKENKKVELKQTDTRARQQSCMISEVDKDLVNHQSYSCQITPRPTPQISESVSLTCCNWYEATESGQKRLVSRDLQKDSPGKHQGGRAQGR